MKIELKKLSLSNFKGIRSFEILFDQITDILGDNATGKTTLMDAFLWLFFGKDSTDRKDFEIKTLDANNRPYHRLDHEVAAVIIVDGEQITIRRTFREKWVKKRGSNEQEFTGHSTEFYWNDVPMKESEYQAKVSSIINENIFKLITNTSYFNQLKWQDRRNALLQIAGSISNDDVFSSLSGDFKELKKALNAKRKRSKMTLNKFLPALMKPIVLYRSRKIMPPLKLRSPQRAMSLQLLSSSSWIKQNPKRNDRKGSLPRSVKWVP
jgi:exonuclease SbcC